MNSFKHIAVDRREKTAFITLRREELNILNMEMMGEINEALKSLDRGRSIRALVIKATGKAFSAGVDVGEHTAKVAGKMIHLFHDMFRLLDTIECPTVSFVHGAALGGGCELACFCDMVLAASGVKFGQPEIKVGVFPPIAAVVFPHCAPLKKVHELLLVGDVITAEEAQQIGLVNQVFPREDFDKKCDQFLHRLTANSGAILRLGKKAIKAGAGKSFGQALSVAEDIYLREMMQTKDANEGLAAFLEKRTAEWRDE